MKREIMILRRMVVFLPSLLVFGVLMTWMSAGKSLWGHEYVGPASLILGLGCVAVLIGRILSLVEQLSERLDIARDEITKSHSMP